jgi:hypothetical protein
MYERLDSTIRRFQTRQGQFDAPACRRSRIASSASTMQRQHSSCHRKHRQTAKRVAQRLEDRGIPVRHGSRLAAIPFDWENP